MFWMYMQLVDERYPEGYLVMAPLDKRQQFDIAMRNAKAVIIQTQRDPLLALNHNTSRLIYKAPVLVVTDNVPKIGTGERVTFSCDGSSYSLR